MYSTFCSNANEKKVVLETVSYLSNCEGRRRIQNKVLESQPAVNTNRRAEADEHFKKKRMRAAGLCVDETSDAGGDTGTEGVADNKVKPPDTKVGDSGDDKRSLTVDTQADRVGDRLNDGDDKQLVAENKKADNVDGRHNDIEIKRPDYVSDRCSERKFDRQVDIRRRDGMENRQVDFGTDGQRRNDNINKHWNNGQSDFNSDRTFDGPHDNRGDRRSDYDNRQDNWGGGRYDFDNRCNDRLDAAQHGGYSSKCLNDRQTHRRDDRPNVNRDSSRHIDSERSRRDDKLNYKRASRHNESDCNDESGYRADTRRMDRTDDRLITDNRRDKHLDNKQFDNRSYRSSDYRDERQTEYRGGNKPGNSGGGSRMDDWSIEDRSNRRDMKRSDSRVKCLGGRGVQKSVSSSQVNKQKSDDEVPLLFYHCICYKQFCFRWFIY